MNSTQQKILYTLQQLSPRFSDRSIPIGYITSTMGVKNAFSVEQQLDILEKRGLISFHIINGRTVGYYLKKEGTDAYTNYALSQNSESINTQLQELKELVETLQIATDAINKGKKIEDKSIMDKLNKHITTANNAASLVKNIVEVLAKLSS